MQKGLTQPVACSFYNDRMSRSNRPKPLPAAGKSAKRHAQRLETLGLIIIVILILAITITRSWHHINWSAR